MVYLFAGESHKNISHDALPLALEHTFLESMEELKVLLDQKPQRAGKRTKDSERHGEREDELDSSYMKAHNDEMKNILQENLVGDVHVNIIL